MHRGFGDAVHVDQLRLRVLRTGIPRLENPGFQRFTAKNHLAQTVRCSALGGNQLPERTRRLVQHRDAGFAQQRITIRRGTADQLRHHQQTPAMDQCAPDFPDREVESKRVEQGPNVLWAEVEPRLSRREQPSNVAVFNHHALRQTGRTRGVDHVGQVRRRQAFNIRIGDGFALPAAAIKINHRHRDRLQQPPRGGLSQHRNRRAVFQQVADPVLRIRRVQRHITGAGLQDPQQPDDHLQTTLDANRHPIIRANTQPDQVMGDLVGPGVEFAVSQGQIFKHHRHGIRLRRRPGFKQSMDRVLAGVFANRRVPRFQQLRTLGRWQDFQAMQRRLRVLLQRLDQIFQHRLHVATHAPGANLCRGHDRQVEAFTEVIHRQ
ncbi:hypothetical protein FX983_06550 [Pseudomonas frederiksbergensis]|uniref:Uncharacterized protein n=1 Tax=Pseudomonas frederiksbergensis TaxID=104087 RepID=A0A6L5BKV1_9PSED|nr:hypothetical protein FX983_06550 [Pseudomonas frederiksbergensis]